MSRLFSGAVDGVAGGLVAGILGEFLVLLVRWLFPTDVAIVGFALIWAVPLGAFVGAVSGWRGWLTNRYQRAAAAGAPGLVAAVLAALMQLSAA